METKNIMIAGVGGQGTLLASRLLGGLLLGRSYDIKVSEVHGMSQRGGSVVTYVRYGSKVYSPIIDRGEADFILAFELLEAARCVGYLRPGGTMIANTQEIKPLSVLTGEKEYPKVLVKKLKELGAQVDAFDALTLARRAGSTKAVNLVLLGRLSKYFDFTSEEWRAAIAAGVPPKSLEINERAFALGAGA